MRRFRKSDVIDAVVAGYLGVDILPGFPASRVSVPAAELFRPGKLVETHGLGFALGGAVANTGLAMKRFGKRVALMGRVGCDALGDIVISQLGEKGAADGVRRNPGAGTAYGIVIAPPGMDRIFLEDPGCNAVFTSDDIDYDTVARSRLFHFGYPPLMKRLWQSNGAELKKMFQRVHELGVATSLDMALPDPASPAGRANWRKILAATLPHVDVFVPSIEEILFMLEPDLYARILASTPGSDMVDAIPRDHYELLAERILSLGVKVLMIKAGNQGAYLRTGDVSSVNAMKGWKLPLENWSNRQLWVDSFPTNPRKIRNACGAGDCAVAGFLTAMLDCVNLETAGAYAMLAGRDNLYGADAFSGLSDWKAMSRHVARRKV